MKTAIILHGMPSKEEYYDETRGVIVRSHWLLWLQLELLKKDILAQVPRMPIPYNPEYNLWKEMFERFPINEEIILVGHSCGAGFIVRYLSENNIKVGKVVLVAPWVDPDGYLKTGMFDFQIDENLVSKTKGVTIFISRDDGEEVKKSLKMIKDKVKNIKVTEFENMRHFCYEDMGTDQFPELLEEVLK